MTAKPEPKPQAVVPNEEDKLLIEKILGHQEYFFASLVAAYRVEIEAQAKRDVENGTPIRDAFNRGKRGGALEALERAAQWHDMKAAQFKAEAARLEDLQGYGYLVSWHGEQQGCHERSAKEIRSLISPTPVEPEVKPCPDCEAAGRLDPRDHLYKTYKDATAGLACVCRGSGLKPPPPAPSRAEVYLSDVARMRGEGMDAFQKRADAAESANKALVTAARAFLRVADRKTVEADNLRAALVTSEELIP